MKDYLGREFQLNDTVTIARRSGSSTRLANAQVVAVDREKNQVKLQAVNLITNTQGRSYIYKGRQGAIAITKRANMVVDEHN